MVAHNVEATLEDYRVDQRTCFQMQQKYCRDGQSALMGIL